MRRVLICALLACTAGAHATDAATTIQKVKPSIVAVGSFDRLRNPQFNFAGTGFVVGDGLLVVTNEHVVSGTLDPARNESLAIAVSSPGQGVQVRLARRHNSDPSVDLALLRIDGPPLPALRLGDSDQVREGESYLLTGYPIGAVLGLFPATHRAMVAAMTPLAIAAPRSDQLDAKTVRRLSAGAYTVFQLDGTAYPGNSGSPLYHAETGSVIGIVNSVLVKGSRETALTQPSGITYAIPATKLKALLGRAP